MAIQMKTQSAQPDFKRLKPHWELYSVRTRHNAIHRNLPVFPHWKWVQHEFGPMRFSGGQGYLMHYLLLFFFCHSIILLLLKLKWSLHICNVKKILRDSLYDWWLEESFIVLWFSVHIVFVLSISWVKYYCFFLYIP